MGFSVFLNPFLVFGCGPPIGPIWSPNASPNVQPHPSSPPVLQAVREGSAAADRTVPPSKDIHSLISRTGENATSRGKGDLAGLVRLRILKGGGCSAGNISHRCWPCKTGVHKRGQAEQWPVISPSLGTLSKLALSAELPGLR